MGKSKLAPTHSILRLEQCAAVLAAEIGNTITDALKIDFKVVKFYSDSRVVLGYITNRRYYNYVANRIQRILYLTRAEQWGYVHTRDNPADIGSRGCSSPGKLQDWLHGPELLKIVQEESKEDYQLILPDEDREVRREITVNKTTVKRALSDKIGYFSSWRRLVRALMVLKRAMRNFKTRKITDSADFETNTVSLLKETERFILKRSQGRSFCEEIKCLTKSKPVGRDSPISALNPYIDEENTMHVGGRLNQGPLPKELINPIILSSKCHTSTLLVRHFHELCNHQERYLTEGKIRHHGYWIVGAKKLISSLLHKCVTCRKLRGKTEYQIMADLPEDRLTPGPPFSYVGVDAFGPWAVVSRRTRGGMAQSKR